VRTIELSDAALSPRPVPTEIWYPATTAYLRKDLDAANWDRYTVAPGLPAMTQQAIRDADAATGPFPLFMYFHGGYGQRREASHICTHLASHGYVAASANFPATTWWISFRSMVPKRRSRRHQSTRQRGDVHHRPRASSI
jgi:predicted dienelactone hydrolase